MSELSEDCDWMEYACACGKERVTRDLFEADGAPLHRVVTLKTVLHPLRPLLRRLRVDPHTAQGEADKLRALAQPIQPLKVALRIRYQRL